MGKEGEWGVECWEEAKAGIKKVIRVKGILDVGNNVGTNFF